MSTRYIHGVFTTEEDLLAVTSEARERGFRIVDTYTPYPVHGIEKAMGLGASRLTWVCFLCGALGTTLALYFQFWTSATDWPLNVGGKPFNSLPAFVPITFEITILLAGLGVVAALFARCGLWPGKRSRQPSISVTDDRFVLLLRLQGAEHTVEDARGLLGQHAPVEVKDYVEEGGR